MSILTWLGVPGDRSAWEAMGFTVSAKSVVIGGVAHALGEEIAWGFDQLHGDPASIGVPTMARPAPVEHLDHPNLIDRIDHVVYAVPELDPAVDALTSVLGEPPRRRAHPRGPEGPEMAFFVVGQGCFIEVVASGRPPGLWGIAFNSPDLDATVAAIKAAGGPVGDPKAAVQGGRIASVWKGHVGWGIAIMEPPNNGGRRGES